MSFVQLPFNALRNLYINGCQVSYSNPTTLIVAPGQVRDSTDSFDIAVSAPLLVSLSAVSVNGLDAGVLAANSSYYIFVLYDQSRRNPPVALASLSPVSPSLPSYHNSTFSHFRMVGFARTDNNAHLLSFAVTGNQNVQQYQWDGPVSVLTAGGSTTPVVVSLSAGMPIYNFGKVQLQSTYIPHAAGETASIKASTATNFTYVIQGIVASVAQSSLFEMIPTLNAGNPSVTYQVSVGTSPAALSLVVTGFELTL